MLLISKYLLLENVDYASRHEVVVTNNNASFIITDTCNDPIITTYSRHLEMSNFSLLLLISQSIQEVR